jgi:ABC-type branched-subunit amino acid transport system substrate-binding protein
MRRRRGLIAALATAALVVGACTDEPGTGETGGGTNTPAEPGAPVRGLTDDTIKVAFIGADFGALAEAGLAPDLGDQQVTISAIVDEINERGGIAGRQIDLRIEIVGGVAGPEAGRAACLAATQEHEAFVVMIAPAVSRDITRCAAVQNETLVLGNTGWDDPVYEEAGGRLFSVGSHTSMGTYRQYRAWADMMDSQGLLDGRTIGVVVGSGAASGPEFTNAAREALLPRLEELGHEVAVFAELPCPEGSISCEQHEAAVERMRSAGVDAVFMAAANLAGASFVQAAQNLGFAPTWFANGNQVTDTVAQFFDGVADWWDGAIGTSTVFNELDDITDVATECNQVVADRSDESYEPGTDAFGFTAVNCMLFRVLEVAAEAVEGQLDQASLIAALEDLGEIPANAGPPMSLTAGKPDSGDYVFLAEYSAERGTFERTGEPIEIP